MFVDRIYFPVTTLGPGERVVVWTCGCTKRCPGCANPELWETRPEAAIEPARLAAVLNDLAGRTGAHRITFTGGRSAGTGAGPRLRARGYPLRLRRHPHLHRLHLRGAHRHAQITERPASPPLLPATKQRRPSQRRKRRGRPQRAPGGCAAHRRAHRRALCRGGKRRASARCAVPPTNGSSCSIRHWKPCITRRCRNRARCRTRCSTAGRYPSASTAGPQTTREKE